MYVLIGIDRKMQLPHLLHPSCHKISWCPIVHDAVHKDHLFWWRWHYLILYGTWIRMRNYNNVYMTVSSIFENFLIEWQQDANSNDLWENKIINTDSLHPVLYTYMNKYTSTGIWNWTRNTVTYTAPASKLHPIHVACSKTAFMSLGI